MRSIHILQSIVAVSLLVALPVLGQQQKPVSERTEATVRGVRAAEPETPATSSLPAQGNQAAAPRLVKVSGTLTEFVRNSASSSVEMTFALYKDEVGGEALWTETQSVEVDKEGRYTVLLGAAQADGVPVELFPAGEPRWLGVEIRGKAPQSRTLLVSVPYALKALDAEKLAGKSLSDFVLSESLGDQVRRVMEGQNIVASQATSTGSTQPGQTKASTTSAAATTAAGPMFPPSTFSGTNATQIVLVQQNGSGNGLYAQTASSTGNSGVVGVATSTSTSNNQNGVIGFNAGAGAGVAGIANNPSAGVGVYGQSATGFAGVIGNSVLNSGFAAGVFGTTSSPDGAGVHGANNNATGFATGVTGFSASVNGNGVFGNATSGSGFANGVFGQTASPGGSGVLGIENATTGFNSGVFGSSASANGTGVFGSSFQWVGVGGQATAPSGGPAYGVWGDSQSTNGVGVAGYEDATSGYTNGVFGQSVSPNGIGVFGVNNSKTGNFNYGVSGVNNATSGKAFGVAGSSDTTDFAGGVVGEAFATSGAAFGVLGQGASPNGFGIFGYESAPSGAPTAVFGMVESPSGIAGQFVDHSGSGLILQGLSGSNFSQVFSLDANGNLNISGNLTVSGTKSSTARLLSGREVTLYAVESPENWFEDFGTAELSSGVAWVPLDVSFAQAVNSAANYHVFLTANGDSNGLYVARKTAAGFEIREHGGGTSNVAFDYRIVARRRGYETIRMAEVHDSIKNFESSRQRLAELANSGNLQNAGVVKVPRTAPTRITPSSTIRPVPPQPVVPQVPKVNISRPPQPR